MKGCNYNNCGYTTQGNEFSLKWNMCASTRMFCPWDHDADILKLLGTATKFEMNG